MWQLSISLLILWSAELLQAQRFQIGVQLGVLAAHVDQEFAHQDSWKPATLHLHLIANIPVGDLFYLQPELGIGERRTSYSGSGVSFSEQLDFRLIQIETGIFGNYQIGQGKTPLYLTAGITTALPFTGSKQRVGSSIDPSSWNRLEKVDFDFFPYRRFSWGPALGFRTRLPILKGERELHLYLLGQRIWEKYDSYKKLIETWITLGIAYSWKV